MKSDKTYRVFVPEEQLDKFSGSEDIVFEETIIDEATQEAFQAKIAVSQSAKEGYERLVIQGRGGFIAGEWFVKILERQDDDDEPMTVFESMKLGDRRGYMLRSMMSETDEKSKKKEQIMTTELQKRLERKKKLVNDLLKKKE